MGTFATKSYDNGIPYTQKFINNASGQAIYIGRADPGTLTSSAKWAIQSLTYDVNGYVTDIKWAGGTTSFDKVMNNYASYVYA